VSYRDPPWVPVEDPDVNRALDEIRRALIELARQNLFIDVTVTLPVGVAVPVRHGLGRAMRGYAIGAPTGATATGRIVESARTAEGLTFTATGYGATVSVPVRFW
jgi:hypothetical protein